MELSKSIQLWYVNAASFILFAILALTGIINWLFIPRGSDIMNKGGFLLSLRHFFRDVHEWTAFLFIIVVIVHLVLHWAYIKTNLKKYGILK